MINGRRYFCVATVAVTLIVSIALCMTMVMSASAADQVDAQSIVDKARITVGEFMNDKQYSWLQEHLKDAKGL